MELAVPMAVEGASKTVTHGRGRCTGRRAGARHSHLHARSFGMRKPASFAGDSHTAPSLAIGGIPACSRRYHASRRPRRPRKLPASGGRRYSPRERPLEPRRSLTRRSGQVARAVADGHSGTAGPRRELRIVCAIPHAMRLTLQSLCPRGRQPWASLLWPGLSPGPRSALLIDPPSASRMSLWSGLWSALSLPDPAI
jgi:hypothetical protein